EAKRWEWFRKYLDTVSNDPLAFVWKAIPDPVDFFADGPPVKDLSAESLPFDLPEQETDARRHFYLLTKFGTWLAGIPVRVGTLASFIVYLVRCKERYGNRVLNPILLIWNAIKTGAGLWWHVMRAPRFVVEKSFSDRRVWRPWVRPLFGWPVWIGS